MGNIYNKRIINMEKEIKTSKENLTQTSEAINEFLTDENVVNNSVKSKDGLIESTKVINKKVIVEDGRELLREITFKHE
jgi:hypothetical protein|tara:strand:- start:1079 stop:1315 length:237 start_codon:yes stop_codon:yes gene_type:complete